MKGYQGNPYCSTCEDYEELLDSQRRVVEIAEMEAEQSYGAPVLTRLRQAQDYLRQMEDDYAEHRKSHGMS